MIRAATQNDAKQIAIIYNHYVEKTTISFEQSPVTITEIQARLTHGVESGIWLVCEHKGSVVGYAYSVPWGKRAGYRRSVEASVYIDHNHVGKGLGLALYNQLLEQLQMQNIHSVIGVIGLPNPKSVALHEKLGFVKVAELKEIGNKFGQWVDVGYWQLLL